MLEKVIKLGATLLLLACGVSTSHAADCAQVNSGTFMKFQIRPDNKYANCMWFSEANNSNLLTVMTTSVGAIPHTLRLLHVNPDGSSTILSETPANADGVAATSIQPAGRKIAVVVYPTDGSTSKRRNIGVFYVKEQSNSAVSITIDNDIAAAQEVRANVNPTPTLPPTPGPGGFCNQNGYCQDPQRTKVSALGLQRSGVGGAVALQGETPVCTSANTPPPQLQKGPERFNLNRALGAARTIRMATAMLSKDQQLVARGAWLSAQFAPNQPYDLKNNPTYLVDQTYGNFVFGAVGAEVGFELSHLLKGGAVVQQYQNFSNSGHAAYRDVKALYDGLAMALLTGKGDNPDDPAPITAGFNYDRNIYQLDPYKNIVTNSCEKSVADDTKIGSAGEDPAGGGWGPSSNFIGASACYGSCGGVGEWIYISDPKKVKAP